MSSFAKGYGRIRSSKRSEERSMDCLFCQKGIEQIDFKNLGVLRKFTSGLAKIRAKKRTGVCAGHQRKLATAIKRARHLGLLPFTMK